MSDLFTHCKTLPITQNYFDRTSCGIYMRFLFHVVQFKLGLKFSNFFEFFTFLLLVAITVKHEYAKYLNTNIIPELPI